MIAWRRVVKAVMGQAEEIARSYTQDENCKIDRGDFWAEAIADAIQAALEDKP